jgi:hypothetical protein
MIKVFYSYSNHNSETCDTYQKVCSYFENNDDNIDIIDVDKTDDNNNILLLNKIQYHIDSSTIFICDITPDYVINKIYNQICNNNDNYEIPSNELTKYYDKLYSVLNSNVSIELGYAISNMQHNNIILIQNSSSLSKIPSLLQGFYILNYDLTDENYHLTITDKIKEYIKNIESQNNDFYIKFKYKITEKSKCIINQLLDIQYFKNYEIIYNNKHQFLIIYKNNIRRQINIKTKLLELKNKTICLSYYTDLYNELKHIELLISLELK